MNGVLEGFGIIAIVVAVGIGLGRGRLLGPTGPEVLSRLVFFVATPALLFTTIATADVGKVLSTGLAVTAICSLSVAFTYVAVAVARGRRDTGELTIGALASGYVNAGNLGIPIAVYVLGDATFVAPVMLFQLMVLSPAAFVVLDMSRTGLRSGSWRRAVLPVLNPITLSTVAGLLVSATGWTPPPIVWAPAELVAGLAVPGALIAFGISLGSGPLPTRHVVRREVVFISLLKLVVQPSIAYVVARFAFGLDGVELLAVTVCAALPTAQNIFVYAMRYERATGLARDAILVTTIAAVPVVIAIAALVR